MCGTGVQHPCFDDAETFGALANLFLSGGTAQHGSKQHSVLEARMTAFELAEKYQDTGNINLDRMHGGRRDLLALLRQIFGCADKARRAGALIDVYLFGEAQGNVQVKQYLEKFIECMKAHDPSGAELIVRYVDQMRKFAQMMGKAVEF